MRAHSNVCLTRVGRVARVSDGRALVEFFDGRALDGVDVTMVKVGRGSYVEVFGGLAMSKLSRSEAEGRRRAWAEVSRAAALP